MLHKKSQAALKIIWGFNLHSLQPDGTFISGDIRRWDIVDDEAVSSDNSTYYYRKYQI